MRSFAVTDTVIIGRMRGRPTADLDAPPNRLRELRQARGWNLGQVADRIGWANQTVQRHETGERQLKTAQLEVYARLYEVSAREILSTAGTMVPVKGYVGGGAEVFPFDDYAQHDGMRMVGCPQGLQPHETVAVEVRGDSMFPIDDGWLLFYSKRDIDPSPDQLIGHLCVVKIADDGPMLVKRVHRGYQPGRYNLISNNAPPREDVELEWAARVKAMLSPDMIQN